MITIPQRAVPLFALALLALNLSGCANPAYPDLPLAEAQEADGEVRVLQIAFLPGTADLEAASATQIDTLSAALRPFAPSQIVVAMSPIDTQVLDARRGVLISRLSGRALTFSSPPVGLSADSAVLTIIPARAGKPTCQKAMYPTPGGVLGNVAPGCSVIESLNTNVAYPKDLEQGNSPTDGSIFSSAISQPSLKPQRGAAQRSAPRHSPSKH